MKKDVAKAEAALHRVVPASDIIEQEDGFRIVMDVPGVVREALAIQIEENELTVTGRGGCTTGEGVRPVHSEFCGVEYARTFTLTDMVDKDAITANLADGVLELFLPRAQAAKPRRIEIAG